ncbi:MAG: ribbon-helix-helix domain-containing protein [Pseudomonadota bacterium]
MIKKSISIKGHQTSIALEADYWAALAEIASAEALTLPKLIARIDRERLKEDPPPGLASALRVFVLRRTLTRRQSSVGDET